MLDNLSLPLVQDVRSREDRAWVAHQVPGKDGAAYQHLGRLPARITVVGLMLDNESLSLLEQVRQKFQDRQPVPFTADIATATEIQQVVIDDVQVREVAGRPQQFRYELCLVEYVPPPPPAAPLEAPGVDDLAGDLMDDFTDALGDLPELPGLLDLNLVDPTPPLESMLDTFTSATQQIGDALGPLSELLGD
jgi:hypothetical protein